MTTAVETVELLLTRIEEMEPAVKAFAWFEAERARQLASESDKTRPREPGPLYGMPIGVKDIFDTAGIPTECGTRALAGRVPAKSAVAVLELESAGAFVVGKTVTAELAFAVPGPTRNPWNIERTPGGSSMGSAAGVAAGLFPASIGTQTNSSIIMPAALCGIVGFKPSVGSISTRGVLDFSRTLDQVGCFAATVTEVANVASAMAGRVGSPPAPLEHPPRLAVAMTPPLSEASSAVRARLLSDIDTLMAQGAEVDWVGPPPSAVDARAVHRTIMAFEAARSVGELIRGRENLVSDIFRRFLAEGRAISGAAYATALSERNQIADAVGENFASYDAILCPAAPDEAPGAESTGDPRFCTMWSLAGVPVIVIPAGRGPSGLPIGLQVVGRIADDEALVAVALWIEAALAEANR